MFDEGSAMAEQGAACDVGQAKLTDWFCTWDTVEALARDADRLYDKCGTNCSMEELLQWRERVMVQLKTALEDEERIFQSLSSPAEAEQAPPGAMGAGRAA